MAIDLGAASTAPRAAPDDARCPRCGGGFHCGMHDPAPCACTTLRLNAVTLSDLRARYHGCLCLRCLQALARHSHAPD
ncbi:MAG TPA: cysteine-rich CWC family protein [Burkholderiaceae bacterium]